MSQKRPLRSHATNNISVRWHQSARIVVKSSGNEGATENAHKRITTANKIKGKEKEDIGYPSCHDFSYWKVEKAIGPHDMQSHFSVQHSREKLQLDRNGSRVGEMRINRNSGSRINCTLTCSLSVSRVRDVEVSNLEYATCQSATNRCTNSRLNSWGGDLPCGWHEDECMSRLLHSYGSLMAKPSTKPILFTHTPRRHSCDWIAGNWTDSPLRGCVHSTAYNRRWHMQTRRFTPTLMQRECDERGPHETRGPKQTHGSVK